MRRKDGAFDERNPLGRKLNWELEDAEQACEQSTQAISEKKQQVMVRYRYWRSILAGRFALRLTITLYLIVALTAYFINPIKV